MTLTEGEQARVWGRGTTSFEAWESFVQGLAAQRLNERKANLRARELLARAIELDPNFASAHVGLGFAHWTDAWWSWVADPAHSMAEAEACARQGLALDPTSPNAYFLLGAIYLQQRRFDEAVSVCERAVDLGPSWADCLLWHGYILSRVGREEEAVPLVEQAIRLSPVPPLHYLSTLSQAYRRTGRYRQALEAAELHSRRAPTNPFSPYLIALAHGAMGNDAEGRAAIARLLELDPSFTLKRARPLLEHRSPEQIEHWLEVLRRLGLT